MVGFSDADFGGCQLDPFGLVLCVFEPLYLLNSSVAQLSGFFMPISVGVGWIASRHPALVNFLVHLWCFGPLASRLA